VYCGVDVVAVPTSSLQLLVVNHPSSPKDPFEERMKRVETTATRRRVQGLIYEAETRGQ
jgi:hypothetical protein